MRQVFKAYPNCTRRCGRGFAVCRQLAVQGAGACPGAQWRCGALAPVWERHWGEVLFPFRMRLFRIKCFHCGSECVQQWAVVFMSCGLCHCERGCDCVRGWHVRVCGLPYVASLLRGAAFTATPYSTIRTLQCVESILICAVALPGVLASSCQTDHQIPCTLAISPFCAVALSGCGKQPPVLLTAQSTRTPAPPPMQMEGRDSGGLSVESLGAWAPSNKGEQSCVRANPDRYRSNAMWVWWPCNLPAPYTHIQSHG